MRLPDDLEPADAIALEVLTLILEHPSSASLEEASPQ